jgi:hypothetical protein
MTSAADALGAITHYLYNMRVTKAPKSFWNA